MTIYWIYIAACLLALGVVLVATPVVKSVALKFGKFDVPCDRKVHKQPMVRLGGVAIFSANSIVCALRLLGRICNEGAFLYNVSNSARWVRQQILAAESSSIAMGKGI